MTEKSSGVATANLKKSNSGKLELSRDGLLESYTSNHAEETVNKKPLIEDFKPYRLRKRSKSSTRPVKAQYQHNSDTSEHEAYLVYQKYYSHYPEPPPSSGQAAHQLYQEFYSKHPPPKIFHGAPINTPSLEQKDANLSNNPQHYSQNPRLPNSSGRKAIDLYQQYFGNPPPETVHGTPANTSSFHQTDGNVRNKNKPRIIVHPTRVIKPSFQDHDPNLKKNLPDINAPADSEGNSSNASYKPDSSQSPHYPIYAGHSGAPGSGNQN